MCIVFDVNSSLRWISSTESGSCGFNFYGFHDYNDKVILHNNTDSYMEFIWNVSGICIEFVVCLL